MKVNQKQYTILVTQNQKANIINTYFHIFPKLKIFKILQPVFSSMLTVKGKVFERASQIRWSNQSFWGCVRGLADLTMGLAFRNRVCWGLTVVHLSVEGKSIFCYRLAKLVARRALKQMPEGKEPQSIPFLPILCQFQQQTLRAWRGITGQQKSTWRTAQRNSSHSSSKSASLGSQLQNIYAIAQKKGNKQDELEMRACLQALISTACQGQKVGWFLRVECWNGRIQALQEVVEGQTRKWCCPLCQWPAGVHGALPRDGWGADWEWMGQD